MNYTTLFPEINKKLPEIKDTDLQYNYNNVINYNKELKVFIPQGKKLLLWFVNHNNNTYSLLLEIKNNKIIHTHFHYLAFKVELTMGCGTIMVVTKINNELSIEKILYLKGKKYEDKNIFNNLSSVKYILQNYIKNINYGEFYKLKIPIIKNSNNFIFDASCLPYTVYNILSMSNYSININSYICNFRIECEDYLKDIYKLYCLNEDNELIYYDTCLVNDLNTSIKMKEMFKKNNNDNIITYANIEESDDENEINKSSELKEYIIFGCLYINKFKKWKPYKSSNYNINNIKKIKFYENKKYE